MPENPHTRRRGNNPLKLTPLPAGTNTKKPDPLAKGEPNNHTKSMLEPPREPPAWKWTMIQGTSPGTHIDEGFTPSTTRGHTTADPTGSVRTENYFTPLYTKSQKTDHTNVNTNHQPPTPEDTWDAYMTVVAAAAAAEADAMEAEAAAANAAEVIARLATEAEAAAAAEAEASHAIAEAAAKAETDTTTRLAAEEASVVEAATEAERAAEVANAAAKAHEAAASAEADKAIQEALEVAAATAAAKAEVCGQLRLR